MRLKNSSILVVLGVMIYAPTLLASGNISFYGNVVAAYHTHQRGKIDQTDPDVTSAVERSDAWAAEKDLVHSVIGSGYTDTKFGMDFVSDGDVAGKLEFGASISETGCATGMGFDLADESSVLLLEEV